MRGSDEVENPRRRLLIETLTVGFFSSFIPSGSALAWNIFNNKPDKLPANRSVYRIQGSAKVNGNAANTETQIRPGDTIETGKDSEMVVVVGGLSMILRGDTKLAIEGKQSKSPSMIVSGLRLLSGKLLSVSRDTTMKLTTPTATIGIRGTGWYAESDPEQTYFCTCYGVTDIAANYDSESKATVVATHHDRPVYILAKEVSGQNIKDAPFINHTDQELALIEALVGRTPPFVFSKDDYSSPRRDY